VIEFNRQSNGEELVDAINRHKMTLTLPSDVKFVLTRAFDAPRQLVFRAWTDQLEAYTRTMG